MLKKLLALLKGKQFEPRKALPHVSAHFKVEGTKVLVIIELDWTKDVFNQLDKIWTGLPEALTEHVNEYVAKNGMPEKEETIA